jgi:hypothetical protein
VHKRQIMKNYKGVQVKQHEYFKSVLDSGELACNFDSITGNLQPFYPGQGHLRQFTDCRSTCETLHICFFRLKPAAFFYFISIREFSLSVFHLRYFVSSMLGLITKQTHQGCASSYEFLLNVAQECQLQLFNLINDNDLS